MSKEGGCRDILLSDHETSKPAQNGCCDTDAEVL